MKNLQKIIEKYSQKKHNNDNYEIGGGLAGDVFASKRHQDAKYDDGKLTFGNAVQMFKKATISDLDHVKDVLNYAVPNMEWHHAGLLPKAYGGGGMKKTYFLNAKEIVMIAENWQDLEQKLEIAKSEKRKKEADKKSIEAKKQDWLKKNCEYVERASEQPLFFLETNREMNGKFGWFISYGKDYKLPEYYTGWVFASDAKRNEYYNIK